MEWVLWPVFLVGGLLSIAALAFWIWALVDCVQVPDDTMYESGNKLIWVLIIIFTNLIGALLYLLIGRPRKGRANEALPSGGGAAPDGRDSPSGGDLPPPPGSP